MNRDAAKEKTDAFFPISPLSFLFLVLFSLLAGASIRYASWLLSGVREFGSWDVSREGEGGYIDAVRRCDRMCMVGNRADRVRVLRRGWEARWMCGKGSWERGW